MGISHIATYLKVLGNNLSLTISKTDKKRRIITSHTDI